VSVAVGFLSPFYSGWRHCYLCDWSVIAGLSPAAVVAEHNCSWSQLDITGRHCRSRLPLRVAAGCNHYCSELVAVAAGCCYHKSISPLPFLLFTIANTLLVALHWWYLSSVAAVSISHSGCRLQAVAFICHQSITGSLCHRSLLATFTSVLYRCWSHSQWLLSPLAGHSNQLLLKVNINDCCLRIESHYTRHIKYLLTYLFTYLVN